MSEAEVDMRRISRRSFLWAGAGLISGYSAYRWLGSRRPVDGLPWPLRTVLDINGRVWTDLFSESAMAPTFDPLERSAMRVNGLVGMDPKLDSSSWRLSVENAKAEILTLDEIKALPRQQFTTQLCCIEGWSIIVTWAGVRLCDFMDHVSPNPHAKFVYLATRSGGYYVGLDLQSARHPQTLLCYEMNEAPLAPEHGAPLRLVVPTKYGIKNLKQIGLIRFTVDRPPDYWADQGYDWYAGL